LGGGTTKTARRNIALALLLAGAGALLWASLRFPFVAEALRDISTLISAGGPGILVLKNQWGVPFWNAWAELAIVGALGVILLFYGKQLGVILFPIVKLVGFIPMGILKLLSIILIFCAEKILGDRCVARWRETLGRTSSRAMDKLLRNGVARFLGEIKEAMHRGLLKYFPAVALILNILPIPILGEVTLVASRTFVGLSALKRRRAIAWLLVNCLIRSFILCAIVYHFMR